jgi:hypothetical protein
MLMFMMNTASGLFHTREQLAAKGYHLRGNRFILGDDVYLPLFEGKMAYQYDHRFATYQGRRFRDTRPTEHVDPDFAVQPRYWLHQSNVTERLGNGDTNWLIGFRDITNAASERTSIFSAIPRTAVGNKFPLVFCEGQSSTLLCCLLANLNSMPFDYTTRQKISGNTMNFYLVKQFPVLPPAVYLASCTWSPGEDLTEWIARYVLELTHTAWDMRPYAEDCGYDGPPFRWDEARRFLLRCELDAAYFHLYGIERDDVDYIMETFPIVKRKDEAAHGEYRTKRVILEIYDEMQRAMETGEPYQTRLDPPPADPRVAHEARD